jgi:hypothetical protein
MTIWPREVTPWAPVSRSYLVAFDVVTIHVYVVLGVSALATIAVLVFTGATLAVVLLDRTGMLAELSPKARRAVWGCCRQFPMSRRSSPRGPVGVPSTNAKRRVMTELHESENTLFMARIGAPSRHHCIVASRRGRSKRTEARAAAEVDEHSAGPPQFHSALRRSRDGPVQIRRS